MNWQSIETYPINVDDPEDGPRVIVAIRDDDERGEWFVCVACLSADLAGVPVWCGDDYAHLRTPEFWQPLPEPPVQS